MDVLPILPGVLRVTRTSSQAGGFCLSKGMGYGIDEGKGIREMVAGTEGIREVCR